jgi:hypothetical protein
MFTIRAAAPKADSVRFVKPVVAKASETTVDPEYYFQTNKVIFIPGKKIISGMTSMVVDGSTFIYN